MSESATPAPAPAAATATQTQQPAQGAETTTDWRSKAEEAQRLADRQKKERITERRQWESERKTLGEKLSRLDKLERAHQQAKLNPTAFLSEVFGEKWYDTVVEAKMNGVPTANVIQSELAKLEEKFEGKLAEREAAITKQREAEQARQVEDGTRQILGQWTNALKSSADKYPALIERYGNHETAARAAFMHARSEWDKTARFDDEGNLVQPGRLLSVAAAAEELEKHERSLVQRISGRLTPASASVSTVAGSQQSGSQQSVSQQRRTLSNSITASTQASTPRPRTREEKLAQANARFAEVAAKHRT